MKIHPEQSTSLKFQNLRVEKILKTWKENNRLYFKDQKSEWVQISQ